MANETKLASIDLIARACYFKIYLVDKYGRNINMTIDDVYYTIEDTHDDINTTYEIQGP